MAKRVCYGILLLTVLFSVGMGIIPCYAAEDTPSVQPLVTMMFYDTDLREALNEIALQTGVNIIPDYTVAGLVTADLKEVPLEKALKMLLVGGGYTFRKMDGYYFIGLPDPKSRTFGELVETRIIELRHIIADKVLAILPDHLASFVNGKPEGKLLSITAPPDQLKELEALIRKIDIPQRQIQVKVIVTEVSSSELRKLGNDLLQFNPQAGGGTKGVQLTEILLAQNALTIEANIFGQLLTKIKLLEEAQSAKIHADPRVLVADGESAELFIGETHTILVAEKAEVDDYIKDIQVGVKLKLTSQIVGQDEILLQIAPEISHFLQTGNPDLVVKQNSILTTIRVKSGQTAVLAGMTVQGESSSSQKVPVLGNIPLIRWFFRKDTNASTESELLVFVTPVIQ